MKKRASGILLHISSLPSSFGIGDMGPAAYEFADFLSDSGQGFWQILPLNPTDPGCGNSPYNSLSALACNPLFISPELLFRDGFLSKKDISDLPVFPEKKVDYDEAGKFKETLLQKAFSNFKKGKTDFEYEYFCKNNAAWIDDYALFASLKSKFGHRIWSGWDADIRDRNSDAMAKWRETLYDEIYYEKFIQFIFDKQWNNLKNYCNEKGIKIIGDMPIYVQHNSSDCWANPVYFKLGDDRLPYAVAGVPPDYFSETGQLWGNPVYNWDALLKDDFGWWIDRLKRAFGLFDLVRIDHFRGLAAFWEVPSWEKTAINGKWIEVPYNKFFGCLEKQFPYLPIVAEDLGIITPDVREIMSDYGFSGMKVLVFAFGDSLADNPYIPHNVPVNSIIYTGTHDTNTVLGWFQNEAGAEIKEKLELYLGHKPLTDKIHIDMMRLSMMSVATLSITPLQDVLGLGADSRMNTPSIGTGNWEWRLMNGQITEEISEMLKSMTKTYGR